MDISIVIPVLNEEENLPILAQEITDVLTHMPEKKYEILFIDDGSRDNSWPVIKSLSELNPDTMVGIRLRKNFGKATALRAGFNIAQGDIIITVDGDLQDDPGEIPHFLAKLEQGFDLVSGWKKTRRDPLNKIIASRIFNLIAGKMTNEKLHDLNCGFKAYRRFTISDIVLYDELHRYIPVLVANMGYQVTEIPVHHRERQYGKSKYGFERYLRGFLDLLTVLAITKYNQRPSHLFSGFGAVLGAIGSSVLMYMAILWFAGYRPIGDRPLLLFGILAVILSVHLISLGLLSEIFLHNSRKEAVENYVKETHSLMQSLGTDNQ